MTVISVIRHGKRSTYVNRGCRCDRCTAAQAAYAVGRQQTAAARRVLQDGRRVALGQVHGRVGTYSNYRCRCGACTEAWVTYMRQYRSRAAAS